MNEIVTFGHLVPPHASRSGQSCAQIGTTNYSRIKISYKIFSYSDHSLLLRSWPYLQGAQGMFVE